MIGRVMLLVAGAVAAAGAVLLGRRKARQQTRARRKAERQAKRARAAGVTRIAAPAVDTQGTPAVDTPAGPAIETAAAPKVADAHAGTEATLVGVEHSESGVVAAPTERLGPAFTSIKGIGPAMAERLLAAGVTSVAQIASWSDADLEVVAPSLKVTPERIRREAWVEQARAVVGSTPAAA
jgi:large subunit ribosomal protein L21